MITVEWNKKLRKKNIMKEKTWEKGNQNEK